MLSHLIKSLKTEHDLCTCTLDFGIVVDSIIMASKCFSILLPICRPNWWASGEILLQMVSSLWWRKFQRRRLSMLGRWLCTMHPRRDSIKALGPFIPLYWVAFLFKICVDFSAKKPRVCQTTHIIIIFFGSQCVKKSLIHMRMYLATD